MTGAGGDCACGAVRYRPGSDPLFVDCCHCRWCQRETGAAFAVNALSEADRIALLSDAPEARKAPAEGGRGQCITRCRAYHVGLRSMYSSDAVAFIRVGTPDEPGAFPPEIHIFTAAKQPWAVIPAGARAGPEFYDRAGTWPAESYRHCRPATAA